MRRVHVHIDSLVLHGVSHDDRRAVARAIERELARQLSIAGVAGSLASLGHIDRVPTARAEARGGTPADIGRAAAHAVARALAPGKIGR